MARVWRCGLGVEGAGQQHHASFVVPKSIPTLGLVVSPGGKGQGIYCREGIERELVRLSQHPPTDPRSLSLGIWGAGLDLCEKVEGPLMGEAITSRPVWALRGSIAEHTVPLCRPLSPDLHSVHGNHFCMDGWTNLNGGLGINRPRFELVSSLGL